MKNQYVLLTGGKNNAGDHLIKLRAKQLFNWIRPDIRILDLNGWEKLSDADLEEVNRSKALILTGGPALQNRMFPNVYALRENLDEIKVPILTMGIGWYSHKGEWKDTHNYTLDENSLILLEKVNNSGYMSSVRDYHTLNILHSLGMKNFLMTGCPALYSQDHIGTKFLNRFQVKKIAYSLGVSMKMSKSMYTQMQNVLLTIRNLFPQAEIEVVFHHSPTETYLKTHGANKALYEVQKKYISWLINNQFNYIDISGSAKNLVNYYSNVDFHIGYRVHAHIFMSSISKPSVLLSEDGRGKALEKVLGGVILDAYTHVTNSLLFKVLNKLSINMDNYISNHFLEEDLRSIISYELEYGVKFSQPRLEINRHFNTMKMFIEQLP